METFTDLKLLYQHLEDKAQDYKFSHQLGELFRKLRDLTNKDSNKEEAEKAQWEIDFFNFTLEDNQLKPMFTGTNDKGEVIAYPILKRFDDKTFEYLIERINSTNNPRLKARYSHILWFSPKKHAKYARIAVDSYLSLIKIFEEKDKESPQEHFGLDVLRSVKNAYSLANQTNYEKEKIKSEIKRLIMSFNFNSSSSFALRANLIELMLGGKRRFNTEDFEGLENICLQVADSLTKKGNLHGAIRMLELGEKIDQKLKKTTHKWREQIAESCVAMMEEAEKKENFAFLTFCQWALENYKKIGDKEKIRELEKKYSELKTKIKLTEIEVPIDLSSDIEKFKKVAEKIAQNESDEIIKILMFNKNLLPKYQDMEKIAMEHSQEFVLQHLANTEILDQVGHLAQHFSDEEEKKYYGILSQYEFHLRLNKIYLIREIFFAAIHANKLNNKILLEFLIKYSWVGRNLQKKLPSDETMEYNWLNLIAPSLHEYFLQMHYFFSDPIENHPNLVLSIDSLTLKIEGLIRDFCQLCGEPTSYHTKDNKGRNIVREKDIHALLYEEPIKSLFDEDDLLFFKFLLVEKAGYNLRHRIAHSLMFFQEYHIDTMHLLILALLRLGKYDFVKAENKPQNKNKETGLDLE